MKSIVTYFSLAGLCVTILIQSSCKKNDVQDKSQVINPHLVKSTKISAGYDDTVAIDVNGFGSDKSIYNAALNGIELPIASLTSSEIKIVIPKKIGSGLITIKRGQDIVSADLPINFEYLLSSTVNTLAGRGQGGTFNSPAGLVADKLGNLYIADGFNSMIKKVTPTGVVSIIAGTGVDGYKDGPGTTALLNHPRRITIDASGNLYFTEYEGHRVRKIDLSGNVSTIAGTGIMGFKDGNANEAQFSKLMGIAIDAAGNLFVADGNNNRIRKIKPGGQVSTFAGNGERGFQDGVGTAAKFAFPEGLTFDSSGNLFVADNGNRQIRKITPAGVVSVFAGSGGQGDVDGSGLLASFNSPDDVVADVNGNLYVANRYAIRKITPQGVVTTYAGNTKQSFGYLDGKGPKALFNGATNNGVAVDLNRNVFVADDGNHVIRKIYLE